MRLGWSALPNAVLYPMFVHRRTPAKPNGRVAIIKLGKLGDNVLALGALKALVDHFGAERCTIVSSSYGRDLVAAAFPEVEILTVTTNHSTLRRTLRDLFRLRRHSIFCEGVDVLVSLQHHRTLHDDLITSAIPAARTWGHSNSELGVAGLSDQIVRATFAFDNATPEPPREGSICQELTLHASLLSGVLRRTVAAHELRPHIERREAETVSAIGVAPFSGSLLRDIPMPLLLAACVAAKSLGYQVHVWAPTPADTRTLAMVERLRAETLADVRLVHTAGTTELVRAISTVQLVVAAESAPAHLAAAMDRPLIAILGGGHFGWFAPWFNSDKQRWLHSRQTCFSCNWVCVHPEPICITQIASKDFQQALAEVLEAAPARSAERASESAMR
jgi:ADP-heptose:LPS heptosyltransferase